MKKTLTLIISLLIINTFTQAQSTIKSDSLPSMYLGLGTGWNSFTGLLGISGDFRLHDKVFVRGGLGLCSWGVKYSVGVKYDKKYNGGLSYNLGFSHYPGIKDLKLNTEVESGEKKDVKIDYLSTNTINLGMSYSWALGKHKTNIFYLEFGYSIPLDSSPWEVKDGSILSKTSKDVLSIMQPGGLILGLGFTFGLQ